MKILIFTIIFGIIVFSFQTTGSHEGEILLKIAVSPPHPTPSSSASPSISPSASKSPSPSPSASISPSVSPSPEPPLPTGDYVIDDFTPYAVPEIPKPVKGVFFKDPLLHTELLKVIDAQSDFSLTTRMAYLGWVRHDAESPDGTRWLVQSTKSPAGHLFNAIPPYSKIRDFPSTIMASFDPDFRWHHTDSNVLYVTYSSKFAKYAVDTGVITNLHDFKSDFPGLAIARVYGKEGGNPSIDSRYWGWLVRCYDATHSPTWWNDSLIVYDKDANGIDKGAVISRLPTTDPKFHNTNFIGMSPSGKYVLVDVLGSGKFYVYPRDFSTVREIPCAITSAVHAFPGVALDDKGREVIVWVEKHSTLPDYWVVMADIATGEKTYLVSFGSSPNFNASGVSYQKPGWAVVSGTKTAGTTPISWSDGEIFIVQLTKNPKPKVWRIVQTHVNRVDHSDDLFAKPNKKGTKIFFRSNWGTGYSAGGITDAYQINLPTDWDKIVLGTIPEPGSASGSLSPSMSPSASPSLPPPIGTYNINDDTYYPAPTTDRPPKGVPWVDPNFGTEIVRITNAPTDVHFISTGRGGTNQAWAGYPKHDSENCDGTLMVIQSQRQPLYHIWNTKPPYNKIKDFPAIAGNAIDADPRWDANDPDVLYFTYSSRFYRWKVSTNVLTLLHEFKDDFLAAYPTFAYVSTREEGTPSDDSRYWAFNGYSKTSTNQLYLTHHICYDKQQNTLTFIDDKNPLFSKGANSLSMSPSGLWVADLNSNSIWPRDFSSKRVLAGGESHADFAYDKTGREVIVCGYQRYSPTGADWGRWARMIDLETGEIFWPAPAPGAQHVSGNSHLKPGWACFSIMTPFYPTAPSNWYDHGIYMVELIRTPTTPTNHGRIWRLFTSPNIRKNYSDDVYAKLNRKGTKIWFSSPWKQSIADKGPTGELAQIDCYQINLPSTWYQDLKGSNRISIITRSLLEVRVGSSYSQSLQITGGTSPYTWSITSGTLPNGLLLNPSTGVISGTPTTPGTFSFTVQVKDSTPQTTAMSLSIRIASLDTIPPAGPKGLNHVK